MEDGFGLIREFLRPHLTATATDTMSWSGQPRSFETVFFESLQRAVAFGARDLEVKVDPETETGVFTRVELSDCSPGLSLTRLRRWLVEGSPDDEGPRDWTRPPVGSPLGPAGFALTRIRTSHAGQTVEAWILPDGTWEIHLLSVNVPGNRVRWYLREPDPPTALQEIRRWIGQRCRATPLRFFVQGERFVPAQTPPDAIFSVHHRGAMGSHRLCLGTGAQGELSIFHRGFLLQTGPSPIPHLSFVWDHEIRTDAGNAGAAVERDFTQARARLEDELVAQLAAGSVGAPVWALFLESQPGSKALDRCLGEDLRGLPFSTRDLVEKTALPVSPVRTLPPAGPELLLLDERRWPAPVLEKIHGAAQGMCGGLDPASDSGIAARRFVPAPDDVRGRWPHLWERLAAREPRLHFAGGLVLAEQHRPGTQAWPFFPVDGPRELARLSTLPPAPWNLHTALWLAVNHPLVEHLTTLAEPPDAVRILARLFLLSQDLEPDDDLLEK